MGREARLLLLLCLKWQEIHKGSNYVMTLVNATLYHSQMNSDLTLANNPRGLSLVNSFF
jgi:hypothetical protein